MTVILRASILSFFLCLQCISQQPPKENRQGDPVSIVRNDSGAAITIETQINHQWQAVRIDGDKDANISGDRIRVATTRADGAMVSVDLPIEAGKKYRLFWNDQAHMWDVSISL